MCKLCTNELIENDEVLDCFGCDRIEIIEHIRVRKLICDDCPNLRRIVNTAIYNISCKNCPLLIEISDTNATVVNCSNCPSIHVLNDLDMCEHLKCDNCSLLEVIALPMLTSLECSDCPRIGNNIITLPNLTYLVCERCTGITELRNVGLLGINCSGCSNLRYLTEMSNIDTLTCNNCPSLEGIFGLYDVDELSCKNCPMLSRIEFTSGIGLDKLFCSDCPSLMILGDSLTTKMLICFNCPSLQYIGEMPILETLDISYCHKSIAVNPKNRSIRQLTCLGYERIPIDYLSRLNRLVCEPEIQHPLNLRRPIYDNVYGSIERYTGIGDARFLATMAKDITRLLPIDRM